ncbi:chemokine XC receptor 1-like [Anabas testudineus]|uniref:G-protein coupled receptors family 1 profile domain-containing protein n=1 Tax=Anabas testudineus TaxID=64144 RepID=A0AAQ6ISB3_ANATE|nr:chemokine XC receptor 1-like [Anabas testudineus]XP_026229809.1 chemokine XC receptor 1-like [Anabas testudineus]
MADNITMSNADVTDSLIFLCDEIFDFTTISGVFFILIFIFSVTGNGLLLCVLVLYENLKNATNLFVLNMACSDLIFTITLPFWAVSYLHQWVFGDFVCKFMTASYYVGLYSSIILLTALTVDRFITVVMHKFPNRVRRQWFAIGACVAAWIISISASVSNAVNVKVENTWNDIPICMDESPHVKLGYYLQVSLLFFHPFAIIVFCYSAILKIFFQYSNRKRHRTTVVMVLCIVAAFFICWGPYNMMIFTATWYEPIGCKAQERFEMAFSICQILAYSHCCMNPLLYMLSQKLRRHLLHLLTSKTNRNGGNPSVISTFQNLSLIGQNSTVMSEMHSKLCQTLAHV